MISIHVIRRSVNTSTSSEHEMTTSQVHTWQPNQIVFRKVNRGETYCATGEVYVSRNLYVLRIFKSPIVHGHAEWVGTYLICFPRAVLYDSGGQRQRYM